MLCSSGVECTEVIATLLARTAGLSAEDARVIKVLLDAVAVLQSGRVYEEIPELGIRLKQVKCSVGIRELRSLLWEHFESPNELFKFILEADSSIDYTLICTDDACLLKKRGESYTSTRGASCLTNGYILYHGMRVGEVAQLLQERIEPRRWRELDYTGPGARLVIDGDAALAAHAELDVEKGKSYSLDVVDYIITLHEPKTASITVEQTHPTATTNPLKTHGLKTLRVETRDKEYTILCV